MFRCVNTLRVMYGFKSLDKIDENLNYFLNVDNFDDGDGDDDFGADAKCCGGDCTGDGDVS